MTATASADATSRVKKLKTGMVATPVGGFSSIQLSAGTGMEKANEIHKPFDFNPTPLDVYLVTDGEHKGKKVFRYNNDMESLLE